MNRPRPSSVERLFSTIRTGVIVSLFAGVGCVNLEKPESVKNCSSSPEGCTDNPVPISPRDGGFGDSSSHPTDLDSVQPQPADAVVSKDSGLADAAEVGSATDGDGGGRDLPATDAPYSDVALSDGADLESPDLNEATADLGPDWSSSVDLDPLVRDAGGEVSAGSCISQIVAAGYAAGSADPCSACRDNDTSLEARCASMLNCLLPPKHSRDITTCQNSVGGSAIVGRCVNDLIQAGCPGGQF